MATRNIPVQDPPEFPFFRLIAGVVALFFVAACLSGYLLYCTRVQTEEQANESARSIAQLLERSIGSTVEKIDIALQGVADEVRHQAATGGIREGELRPYLKRQLTRLPELDSLRIADARGVVLYESGHAASGTAVSIADRDYFLKMKAEADADMVVSKPIIDKISNKLVITCVRRISMPDNSFGGVAYGVLPLQRLNDLFAQTPLGLHGTINLRGADTALIARYSKNAQGKIISDAGTDTVSPVWRTLLAKGETNGSYIGVSTTDGHWRIYSYRLISPYQLYVIVGLAADDYLREWRNEIFITIAFLVFFLGVLLLMTWLIYRNWRQTRETFRTMAELEESRSDRKQQLEERERLLSMLEATRNELYVFDVVTWELSYVNNSAVANLGYTREQLLGMKPLDFMPELERSQFQQMIAPLVAGEQQLVSFETVHRRTDGSEYPVDVFLQLVESHCSSISSSYFLAVIHDASQRKASEKKLKRNYDRLELMQDASQFHAATVQELFSFSLEKVIALTESGIGYIYHYNEEERQFILNTWSKDVMAACSVAEPQSLYQLEKTGIWGEVVRQRKPIIINDFAAANPLKKGYPEGHVPLSRFLSVPLFENDRIVAVVGVANKAEPYDQLDLLQLTLMMEGIWKIASRLLLEEKILQAGREWQSTFDSISDSISLIDADQRVIRCNRATSRLLGREFADIINQPCWKLFHGTDALLADCPMEKARLSLHSETAIIKNKARWLEVTVDPLLSESRVLVSAVHIVRDVTERILLEQSLLQEKVLYKDLVDTLPVGIYRLRVRLPAACDVAGCEDEVHSSYTVDMMTDRFCDILGIDSQTLKDNPNVVADMVHPEDRADFTEKSVQALTCHEPFRWEGRFGNEKKVKWIRFESLPRLLDNGDFIWTGVITDITDFKQAEEKLREMQAQMMQNDKLATIGQLAAGVAHEINNPVGFVGSNMATLARYIEKYNRYIDRIEEEIRACSSGILPEQVQSLRKSLKLDYVIRDISMLIEENNEGIDRIKRIVQDLKTFSRTDSFAVSSVDLNSCMDSTINIVINELKYAAELKRIYGELPRVSCNAQQINQVFMNLLINAAHAIQARGEKVGVITIRTWSNPDNAFASVSDTGCGVAPENYGKIFDAFFTTKEVGKGTGLGLSISSGIIRKHGGEIMLASELGVGSTFTVRLPLKPPLET